MIFDGDHEDEPLWEENWVVWRLQQNSILIMFQANIAVFDLCPNFRHNQIKAI
jgi:hypothetical protein